ncbi:MAG: ABC transporter ATP-binding protein, partial [Parachlamydiaceae bacterium]|nr:ABC transporter ATP-binding protein [Parachlamydiaceae bacterium]
DPSSALNPVFTIGNQLLEAAELHLNLYGEEAEEKIILALTEVGISSPKRLLDDYPFQLSGGMKQRIMIAMALLGEPDILIADEPTTALDVTIQAQVLDLIRNLQKKKETALLLITHDMGVVAEMADDVIVMYASENVEFGNVVDIFDKAAHPYTKGLFSSLAGFADPTKPLKPIEGTVPSPTHYPPGCKFHPRCPFVMEKCRSGTIPFFSIDEAGSHQARCLLYDGSAESVSKMKGQ